MLHCDDVPTKVAINEALELAKRYSTAQSSRFVNGILDRLQAVDPSAPRPSPEAMPDGTAKAEATESPAPADKPTPLSVKSSRAIAPSEEPTPVRDEASEAPGPTDEPPPTADTP